MTTFDEATELVRQYLSRAQGYPTDTKAFCGLVNGLVRAEQVSKVPAQRIVERCAELSKFCPTDYDLQQVAKDMARCDAVASGTFDSLGNAGNAVVDSSKLREQYGEPAAFDWKTIDHAKVKRVRDRERALISAIKAKYPKEIGWAQIAIAAAELGYYDYAEAWQRSLVSGERITAAQWKARMEGSRQC